MIDARPTPPDREANLAAVDPRLLTELQFPLALVRPNGVPWLQALLKLGEVANTIVPLMGVWMARWSSVLDYEGSDQPLVHARWVDGAESDGEQTAATPAPPVVRSVSPPAQHTHSTIVHRQIEVLDRPATRAIEAVTRSAGREARPVVEARPVRPDLAVPELPVVAERRVEQAVEQGSAPIVHPPAAGAPGPVVPSPTRTASPVTTPVSEPTTVATPAPPMVHAREPADAPGAPTMSQTPAASAARPVAHAASVAESSTAAAGAPDGPPRVPAEPPSAVPPAVRVYDAAAETSGGRRARVVSRGVTTRRPDGRLVPVATAAPAPAALPARTVAEIGAAPTPIAVGTPSSERATPSTPAVPADGHAGQPAAPFVHAAPVTSPAPSARSTPRASNTARPVVQAVRAPAAATLRPADLVQGAPATAAPAGPSIVHARPVVAAAPGPVTGPPGAPGPAPGPARPSPAFTPVGVPRTAEEARRMLGMPAPTAAPPPAPANAEAPAASAAEGPLSPRQISNITQVVQTRVIRHLERERERTRTRV